LRSTRARILVVEDNEVNRIVLVAQLRTLGYDSQVACNGREALVAHDADVFDGILTDYHMPEMDGFAMARHIRGLERSCGRARIPIIALTADALSGEIEQSRAAGIDAYLTKPVRLMALQELLARLVRPAPADAVAHTGRVQDAP
jgi:CheY-like chemotaxis protein